MFTPTHTSPTTPSTAPVNVLTRCSDGDVEIRPMALDDLLGMIAKVVGHKQLEHRMRVSASLLNQWISGEKTSFLRRTEEFIDVLGELHQTDLALALLDHLAQRVGGAVIGAEQVKAIKEIAGQAGTRVRFDEWRNSSWQPWPGFNVL